jgi:hypothetical protein
MGDAGSGRESHPLGRLLIFSPSTSRRNNDTGTGDQPRVDSTAQMDTSIDASASKDETWVGARGFEPPTTGYPIPVRYWAVPGPDVEGV